MGDILVLPVLIFWGWFGFFFYLSCISKPNLLIKRSSHALPHSANNCLLFSPSTSCHHPALMDLQGLPLNTAEAAAPHYPTL